MPFQDRRPDWRDTADVCVIDLKERMIQTVYTTSAFGVQTGAQVQWGKTDRHLYFNDKSGKAGGQAVAIRLDWQAGKAEELEGPVYHVAPDESGVISPSLDLINQVGWGYGADIAPQNRLPLPKGAPRDQGLWYTDVKTRRKRLLVSLAELYEVLPNKNMYQGLDFYLFHTKFNPQGTRIMQVFRARDPNAPPDHHKHGILMTFKRDASDIRIAVTPELWDRGGHHPNWHPDGEQLLMNLKPQDKMQFCVFRYDGTKFRAVSDTLLGSGHPSFEKTGRYLFSDCYPFEPMALPNGEVVLRLIDTRRDTEQDIATVLALGRNKGVLRLDPHPAWSRDGKKVCFNGAPDGRRQVFIANLENLIGGGRS
jgi:hypothetical protein